ncbi:MAG: HAD-IA family hydrolase [Muribaculaceae bacterium]
MVDIKQAVTAYLQKNNFSKIQLTTALIDMDGVLYDSMKNHTAAWFRMATEMGIDCERNEFYCYEGMTGVATINILFQRAYGKNATEEQAKDLYKKKAQYFIELGEPVLMPDADRMLRTLKENDITPILVTGSGQNSLLNRLDIDYPNIFQPAHRITAHDVTHGKPNPEPYLKGMELAHSLPNQSIVIENAPLGVEAGHSSGCFTIGITTGPIPINEMWDSGADIVFSSMTEFANALPELIGCFKKLFLNDYN